jgi:hypothetical protein
MGDEVVQRPELGIQLGGIVASDAGNGFGPSALTVGVLHLGCIPWPGVRSCTSLP